jgi:hypothetical protein
MEEKKINEKMNPISLKRQTWLFYKGIKPNKIANNYLNNLKKKH